MTLGYVVPVELEIVLLNSVRAVTHLKELKNKIMKSFLLPLICPVVSFFIRTIIVDLISIDYFMFILDSEKKSTSNWTCEKCSFTLNQFWSDSCESCGWNAITMMRDCVRYTPPKKKWTCKRCTLLNDPNVTVCNACGGSKAKSLCSDDGTIREFWTCDKCTLKNRLSALVCKACKTDKRTNKKRRSDNQCPDCTYENEPNAKKCFVCQKHLDSEYYSSILISNHPKQQSKLMENLRTIEEQKAREKWNEIVLYCNQVKMNFILFVPHRFYTFI